MHFNVVKIEIITQYSLRIRCSLIRLGYIRRPADGVSQSGTSGRGGRAAIEGIFNSHKRAIRWFNIQVYPGR